jgi:hypothetical protein
MSPARREMRTRYNRAMITAKRTARTEPAKARRPRSAMNAFGRKMADLIEKTEAANKRPMSMAQIEREVIKRRGGILR